MLALGGLLSPGATSASTAAPSDTGFRIAWGMTAAVASPVDYELHGPPNRTGVSAHECEMLCAGRTQCTCMTHQPRTGCCWLHDNDCAPVPSGSEFNVHMKVDYVQTFSRAAKIKLGQPGQWDPPESLNTTKIAPVLTEEATRRVPIYINNWNSLETTRRLVQRLLGFNYSNIIILDNNSTYLPLLTYYEELERAHGDAVEVRRLGANLGHMALWKTGTVRKQLQDTFFVLTDADIELPPEFPSSFVRDFQFLYYSYARHLRGLAKSERGCPQDARLIKIGAALRIDHLPREQRILALGSIEQKYFWTPMLYWDFGSNFDSSNVTVFNAAVDTTFALYPPQYPGFCAKPGCQHAPRGGEPAKTCPYYLHAAVRVGGRYMVEHVPWRYGKHNLPPDLQYVAQEQTKGKGVSGTYWGNLLHNVTKRPW